MDIICNSSPGCNGGSHNPGAIQRRVSKVGCEEYTRLLRAKSLNKSDIGVQESDGQSSVDHPQRLSPPKAKEAERSSPVSIPRSAWAFRTPLRQIQEGGWVLAGIFLVLVHRLSMISLWGACTESSTYYRRMHDPRN